MGPLGPLPWKVMGHILKSWDNDSRPTINLKARNSPNFMLQNVSNLDELDIIIMRLA